MTAGSARLHARCGRTSGPAGEQGAQRARLRSRGRASRLSPRPQRPARPSGRRARGGDVGVLQRFERRIEEMVNRPFARAFKAEVQPVEIASALQRECDDRAAIVARGRTMVPNAFVVALGSHDHERLSVYAEALGAELAVDGPRARRGAGLRVHRPGDDRLRAGRGPAHRPVPGAQRRRRGRHRGRVVHRGPGGRRRRRGPVGRGRHDDVRAGPARDPDRPRRRHRPAHRRPRHLPRTTPSCAAPAATSPSSTWARPTAWSSTASGSSRHRLRDGAQVRLGSTTLIFHEAQ